MFFYDSPPLRGGLGGAFFLSYFHAILTTKKNGTIYDLSLSRILNRKDLWKYWK